MMKPHELPAKNIVFFDGVCSLCNRSIDFLIRHDRHRRLHYAPLQGETFAKVKAAYPFLDDANSMVLIQQNAEGTAPRVAIRSTAVLRAVALLPAPWAWARIFLVIPSVIRDFVYKLVARTRYKIFGRQEICRLPTAEEQSLFLP